MDKTQEALKLALEALEQSETTVPYEGFGMAQREAERKHKAAITAIREALAEQPAQQQCNPHPKAPHGFDRNASHSADRYVCECEGWDAYEAGYQAGIEKALELDAEPQPAQGCEFCSHPLYAGTKCKNCGCEQPAYRAVKTVHEGKAYYVSEPEQQPAQLDPSAGTQVSKVWWDGDKLMAQPIPLENLYKEPEQPAQQRSEDKKQWVGLTSEQWFSWWQVSTIMDNTEAEIDFADFLMIALAVQDVIGAKLREKNTGEKK